MSAEANPAPGPNTKVGYVPALDGLRAIAVLAVIYTHYYPADYWIGDIYWGNFGVRLFFVISGFLITDGILAQVRLGTFSYYSFMIRRVARLYPALLFFVFLCVVSNVDGIRSDAGWHLLYLSNVLFAARDEWGGTASHLWSLAVEHQFYVFWPLLLIASQRHQLVTLYGIVLCGPIFRSLWSVAGFGDIGAWVLPPACFDALGIGALVALSRQSGRQVQKYWTVAAFLAVCLMLFPFPSWLERADIGQTGAALLFGYSVYHLAVARAPTAFDAILSSRSLRYVGAISYGIYLYHTLSLRVINWASAEALPIHVAAVFGCALTLVTACLSFHIIEEPLRKRARVFAMRHETKAIA